MLSMNSFFNDEAKLLAEQKISADRLKILQLENARLKWKNKLFKYEEELRQYKAEQQEHEKQMELEFRINAFKEAYNVEVKQMAWNRPQQNFLREHQFLNDTELLAKILTISAGDPIGPIAQTWHFVNFFQRNHEYHILKINSKIKNIMQDISKCKARCEGYSKAIMELNKGIPAPVASEYLILPPDFILEDKINAFKMIYAALRAGQTNTFGYKTNFLEDKENFSPQELMDAYDEHVLKHKTGRAAKAMQLVNIYWNRDPLNCGENNLDLISDIFRYAYEKSGIWRSSKVNNDFFKEGGKLTQGDIEYAKTHPQSARGKILQAFLPKSPKK